MTLADSQHITLNNGNYDIPAIFSVPDKKIDKQIPAVIMLHGTGTQKDEVGNLYKSLSEKLEALGIASIRLDFAGSGDSKASDLEYSLSSAVLDGKTAFNYLQANSQIDKSRIGVVGFSQGALISQLLVIEEPNIKSLAVWSPAVGNGITPMKTFFEQYYDEAKQNGYALIKYDWRSPFKVNLTWFEQLKAQQSLTLMKQFTGSLLAISGTNDTVLPWENANTLITASGSKDATAVTMKDGDHIFNVFDPKAHQSKELLEITAKWLNSRL
ncbi:alpha/beta hydrolase family protein [Photobacterium leiognathi]|uniref:alpha/beta hydrolase family protein n=1 Tax=Photobacterium leiognathi TaxID=553611 RepID=UPI002980B066|nr:alpha/beta hydrolase [Photobacterium leiognathi]